MKANKYYTKKNSLELLGTKIPSNKCGSLSIKFTIDARHILLALHDSEDLDCITRKDVEKKLRDELFYYGENWYASPFEGDEEGNYHYGITDKLPFLLEIGQKLFPEFFGVPQSVNYFTKEK